MSIKELEALKKLKANGITVVKIYSSNWGEKWLI